MCKLLEVDWGKSYSQDLEPYAYLMEKWCSSFYYSRKKLFDTEAVFLGETRKDPFNGTSISSVSIASWSKGLNTVNQLKSKVREIFQEELLSIINYNISLQKKIVFLQEKLMCTDISSEDKLSIIKFLSDMK